MSTVNAIILPRRNTAAGASANNQIPMQGERVYETDTKKWKTGDGVTHYNDLPYDIDTTTATGRAIAFSIALG